MPSLAPPAPEAALTWEEAPDSTPTFRVWRIRGPIERDLVSTLDPVLLKSLPAPGGQVCLDLAGVPRIDSAGTAWLVELWRAGEAGRVEVKLRNVPPGVRAFLEHYRFVESPPSPIESTGILESLGDITLRGWTAIADFLVLAADVTVLTFSALARPWRLRWEAIINQASLTGSQAFGIVGLITFLVGLTLAFQSAYQLQRFGAAIYVATLTAISVVREMGPLITAILVAGRSGSSITSEVATMKVNEEIDAMQVMGISFIDFVALPKLVALVAMVPLLTILADVMGIAGGWVVAVVYLDLGSTAYIQETIDSLVVKDLVIGLVKSVSFAWGIGLLGLYHGLRVHGGAAEVGRATTASVVSAIFFIIVADSLYSVLFYVVLR